MSHGDRIARPMIELDDWRPVIWRRVEVPLTSSFKALLDVIQAAMPFEDYQFFEFHAEGKRYAIPDPEWNSLRQRTFFAKTTKLGALVDCGIGKLSYTFDFGDDWRHTVTFEKVLDPVPGADCPRYIDGARCAPPEDVGGLPGFELFLAAVGDPDYDQHGDLMRWHGRPFDPERVDQPGIQARLAKLARRRAIRKAMYAKSQNKVN